MTSKTTVQDTHTKFQPNTDGRQKKGRKTPVPEGPSITTLSRSSRKNLLSAVKFTGRTADGCQRRDPLPDKIKRDGTTPRVEVSVSLDLK